MSILHKYNEFLQQKVSGPKPKARALADAVIEMYRDCPDLEFVYTICDQCENKIDFFIWKEIVYPELAARMLDDPRAVRGMIQTIQNLYSSKHEWNSLQWVTEYQLVANLLKMVPDDPWAQERRENCLVAELEHAIHEWPSGILYGMNGATTEQCEEILDMVVELRDFDTDGRIIAFCDDVEEKTRQYMSRLDNTNH